MSAKFLVLFLLVVQNLYNVQGLRDECRARYRTGIVKKCIAQHKECCKFSPPCSMRYFMTGTWRTEIDEEKSNLACGRECLRHFNKCRRKCRCAVYTKEVRSSDICKCVRNISDPALLATCTTSCFTARTACVSGCIAGPKCPLRAVTEARWDIVVPGRCHAICLKEKALGLAQVPKCPAVAPDSSGEGDDATA